MAFETPQLHSLEGVGTLEQYHTNQLVAAKSSHDKVRKDAELALYMMDLQIKLESSKRTGALLKEIEAAETAEHEFKAQEAKRVDKVKKEAEAAQKAKEESEQRAKAAKERQAKEVAEEQRMAQVAQNALERHAAAVAQAQSAPKPEPAPQHVTPSQEKPSANSQPSGLLHNLTQQPPTPAATPKPAAAPQVPSTTPTSSAAPNASQAQKSLLALPSNLDFESYRRVHAECKAMRSLVKTMNNADGSSSRFKRACNDDVRTMRMKIGQLTPDVAQQKQVKEAIFKLLLAALNDTTHTFPVHKLTTRPRTEKEGAINNGAEMSLKCLYLLNAFAKIAINQWINEAYDDGRKATPIAIVVASIFSNKQLLWRGLTLVDMLMAKFCVACPVLFGARGNEATIEGRVRLGWRRKQGEFVHEAVHDKRMSGLASGFASLAFRDFTKAPSLVTPCPPSNYWFAMAAVLHTPPNEVCGTHYLILRGLIKDHVRSFIRFYGDFARASLQMAIVQFPARDLYSTSENKKAFTVLATEYKQAEGIDLLTL